MRHLNWVKVLAGEGEFSDEAKQAAAKWATCAVGESHRKFPKVVIYSCPIEGVAPGPADQTLYDQGSQFYIAIVHSDRPRARKLYLQIKKYVSRLHLQRLARLVKGR